MTIGPSGVGKSTLMNAILQGSKNMELDDDYNIVCSKKLNYNNKNVF